MFLEECKPTWANFGKYLWQILGFEKSFKKIVKF